MTILHRVLSRLGIPTSTQSSVVVSHQADAMNGKYVGSLVGWEDDTGRFRHHISEHCAAEGIDTEQLWRNGLPQSIDHPLRGLHHRRADALAAERGTIA